MTTIFLLCALFFPRISLVMYYMTGMLPVNTTPFAADVVATIFLPRFLVAFWTYESGEHIIWTILFVLLGLAELDGALKQTSKQTSKST